MLFRFAVASAVLGVFLLVKKAKIQKDDWPDFIGCGLAGIFCYMYLFNTGTNMVASGVSSFIIASAPVFTMILSSFMLREKTKLSHVAGILISFAGLVIISLSQINDFQFNFGVVILIAAATCTSYMNIIQRKLSAKYSAFVVTAYTMIIGTIPMFLFSGTLFNEIKYAPISAEVKYKKSQWTRNPVKSRGLSYLLFLVLGIKSF